MFFNAFSMNTIKFYIIYFAKKGDFDAKNEVLRI